MKKYTLPKRGTELVIEDSVKVRCVLYERKYIDLPRKLQRSKEDIVVVLKKDNGGLWWISDCSFCPGDFDIDSVTIQTDKELNVVMRRIHDLLETEDWDGEDEPNDNKIKVFVEEAIEKGNARDAKTLEWTAARRRRHVY